MIAPHIEYKNTAIADSILNYFVPKSISLPNWVNTERPIYPIQNKGIPICQSLGVKGIYKVQTSSGKWYVCNKHQKPIGNKYLYDEIKRFARHKDGTCAIGIFQNQSWKIGTNGLVIPPNTNIAIDSKGNYVSANGDGADYVSETKKTNKRIIRKKRNIDSIITEVLNDFFRRELLIA